MAKDMMDFEFKVIADAAEYVKVAKKHKVDFRRIAMMHLWSKMTNAQRKNAYNSLMTHLRSLIDNGVAKLPRS